MTFDTITKPNRINIIFNISYQFSFSQRRFKWDYIDIASVSAVNTTCRLTCVRKIIILRVIKKAFRWDYMTKQTSINHCMVSKPYFRLIIKQHATQVSSYFKNTRCLFTPGEKHTVEWHCYPNDCCENDNISPNIIFFATNVADFDFLFFNFIRELRDP